jgi:AcrR family transcriptional regulator
MKPTSMWEKIERSSKAPSVKLTHTMIAQAAVRVADAEGLQGVTLRRLASELEVATMAIYRYVSSKEDILELMVDAVQPEARLGDGLTNWREAVTAYASNLRASMKQHEWIVELPPRARLSLTPRRFAAIEAVLSSLDGQGLSIDSMMLIVETVSAYTMGVTASEIARAQLISSSGLRGVDGLREALGPQMAWLLNSGQYPTYARYIREAKDRDREELRFSAGLDFTLNGISASLKI